MAEGMAKVENTPYAAFLFIRGNDLRLELDGLRNRPREQLSVFAQKLNRTLCQSLKQFRVANDAAFNGFVHSCAEFAFGQSRERGGIDENYRGLIKGAEQILSRFQIHSGLAAYGCIELCLHSR